MSLLGQTLILYLLVGIGVAGAAYLSTPANRSSRRLFQVLLALPFWPLYVPLLLAKPSPPAAMVSTACGTPVNGSLDAIIAQVDSELQAALGSLDGWGKHVLAQEKDRLNELGKAWRLQAERIRELDRLLAVPEYAGNNLPENLPQAPARWHTSQAARQRNLDRLRAVRKRAHSDLLGSLAWVRELVSLIHLAKYTGAPAARAEELVAQIAAAVQGLSDFTSWPDEPLVVVAGDT